MYVARGLLAIVALPLLFGLLLVLAGVGFFDGSPDEETFTAIWLALSGASFVYGAALVGLSGWLSRRGEVRFDRARGVVVAGSVAHPFEGLEVRVSRRPGLSGWSALELVRQDAPVVTLNDRLQSLHAADVASHAAYVAQLIGAAPLAPSAASPPRLFDDRTAAMLCYLPLQGIHVIASLYYLASAHDRPFVRFAAKQSLLQLAATMVSLVVLGVGLGVPLAIVSSAQREIPSLGIALIVALSLSLLVIALANVVAHLVACVRAYHGRAWVIPWLRPIAARWLPR